MLTYSPGYVSLAKAHLSAAEFANAIGQPERTVRVWLARWLELGVAGISAVPGRGRYGVQYAIRADVPRRWRACRLPNPQVPAGRSAA